jgi:hypothetical protein
MYLLAWLLEATVLLGDQRVLAASLDGDDRLGIGVIG